MNPVFLPAVKEVHIGSVTLGGQNPMVLIAGPCVIVRGRLPGSRRPVEGQVLLVDDEPNILATVRICLEDAGFAVEATSDPEEALLAVRERSFDIAFFDLKMQPVDGMRLLRELRARRPETTVVLMTAHGSIATAVEAIKLGAFDYLQKPFEFSELQLFAEKVLEHHRLRSEVRRLREEVGRSAEAGAIVPESAAVRSVVDLALQVAPSSITVLIEGESGTGKELLARLIHRSGLRADKPFVQVHCAALPESLLESKKPWPPTRCSTRQPSPHA